MTRDDRNAISYSKFKAVNFRGTFVAVPRYGKTRYALEILKTISIKFHPNIPNMCIIVRSIAVKQMWEYELDLMNEDSSLRVTVTIFSISEAMLFKHSEYYFVVFDEIHRFMTPDAKNLINGIKFKYKYGLGLTGTKPTNRDDLEFLNQHLPIFDSISREEAISNNWILPKIEINYLLELSDSDKIEYARLSKNITYLLTKYKGLYKHLGIPFIKDDFTLLRACYTGIRVPNEYLDLTNNIQYITASAIIPSISELMISQDANPDEWTPNKISEDGKFFIDFVRLRNDIIVNNNAKKEAVLKIAELFKEPTICFNESIDFAEDIVETLLETNRDITPVVYHGSIKSRPILNPDTNQYYTYVSGAKKGQVKYFGKKGILNDVIEGLKEARYTFLSTVKALDEGINVPNLSCVICTAGTMNPTPYIQRTERASTVFDKRQPIVFNLAIGDYYMSSEEEPAILVHSRDLIKLKSRQQAAGVRPIWIHSVDELIELSEEYYNNC